MTTAVRVHDVVVEDVQVFHDYVIVRVVQNRPVRGKLETIRAVFKVYYLPGKKPPYANGDIVPGTIHRRETINPPSEEAKKFPLISEKGYLLLSKKEGMPVFWTAVVGDENEFGELDFFLEKAESSITYEDYLRNLSTADPIQ